MYDKIKQSFSHVITEYVDSLVNAINEIDTTWEKKGNKLETHKRVWWETLDPEIQENLINGLYEENKVKQAEYYKLSDSSKRFYNYLIQNHSMESEQLMRHVNKLDSKAKLVKIAHINKAQR